MLHSTCVRHLADLGRLRCRKLQERRLPRGLPPLETRDVGLGIRFVCYSESERKEEAKKRLEKRLEKRENT